MGLQQVCDQFGGGGVGVKLPHYHHHASDSFSPTGIRGE